jgi:hypothetical protein
MNDEIKLLDVVMLRVDLPEEGLSRGQIGTVVEIPAEGVFEVEFTSDEGETLALIPLKREQLTPVGDVAAFPLVNDF